MPYATRHLQPEDGALIEILVGVVDERLDLLRRMELPIPARVRVPVQIDTGTSLSVLTPSVFQQLGIQPMDPVEVETVTQSGKREELFRYPISIGLEQPEAEFEMHLPALIVLGGVFPSREGHFGLLGRDILEHCSSSMTARTRHSPWRFNYS